jgi:hypothetical protein
MIKQILKNNKVLAILGFIFFNIIIWNRFLRIRLPKELPLMLSTKYFFVLCCVSIILFVTLCVLILNYFEIHLQKTKVTKTLSDIQKNSLYELDHTIKKTFEKKAQIIIITIINYLKKHLRKKLYIYLCLSLPKIILPCLFIYEIFIIGYIYYFYILLVSLVLVMIYNYIYYSIHYFYIEQIESIEKVLYINVIKREPRFRIENLGLYGSHFYIQEKTLERLNIKQSSLEFHVELNPQYIRSYLHNATQGQQEHFFNDFCSKSFRSCSQIYEVLYSYTILDKTLGFYLNLYMLFTYLIGWLYILFSADYSQVNVDIFCCIKDNIEPFSHTYILFDYDIKS